MITQEQALATADRWLNGGAPAEQQREVRHREFALGWVVWAAPPPPERDPVTGERRPPAEIGAACGVVDRETGELSVWSSVPVEEVARAYEARHAERVRRSGPPATGPGNTAVATYVDPATGGEVSLFRLSAPGLPPAEYQVAAELRRLGVPAGNVVAVHTDLRPASLPGGYPAALLEQAFPNAELSCGFPYGIFADERAEGVAKLADHAERTAALAGQQPPPRPCRVPAPRPGEVEPAPAVRDVALGRRVAEAFGAVVRYDADDVAASALPEAARSTLVWAGLPAEVPLFFVADRPKAPPAGGLFADLRTHLSSGDAELDPQLLDVLAGWSRIGSDGLCVVAVQCNDHDGRAGSVWAVHPRTGSGRYVNASPSAFLRSLEALVRARTALPGLDPYAAGAVVASLQGELAAIDPDAFHKESAWWSVVVEQMWHGLF
ncbi:SUKH-4 family immunity protein [Kitasatospora sp. NA04385]|uniref:SUKH-4 family immunity protein n=1 Tax=Kitasatospora sp. NA04385 TaxID=2742135 RepID=UPI0015917539|nr:SUKH-4 family immunity protein [Kitasatospora sp. NA04385]QKW22460.1 SUKH-4 family immunity protein [Kitasatospora sp. NA04385]